MYAGLENKHGRLPHTVSSRVLISHLFYIIINFVFALHYSILALPDDPDASFFGVYDGHGGCSVAQYAGKHLHKFIVKQPEYPTDIAEAMRKGFLAIDEAMLEEDSLRDVMAGSTAVTVMIRDGKLYCANAGDSRAIASVNGQIEILSNDHKPNNETELKRICEGGGWVEFNRVNGNLALSRALGDFVFKRNSEKTPQEQIVTGKLLYAGLFMLGTMMA